MDEKIQQARETVSRLNELLGEDVPYKLDLADPKTIKLVDKNARYMGHEMFQNLVNNVKKDGGLSSLPLCYKEEEGLLVLSGNHRVQAAAQAGLSWIMILVIDRPLTRQEQVAIQLSHNAIAGKDDQVILKQLWDEIEDIDLKLYAGLDSELIGELDKLEFVTISDAAPDFKQIILLFLPEEVDQLKALLQEVDLLFSGDSVFLASRAHYQAVFDLTVDIKERFQIVNNPTALMKIMELARERLSEIDAADPVPESIQ